MRKPSDCRYCEYFYLNDDGEFPWCHYVRVNEDDPGPIGCPCSEEEEDEDDEDFC